MKTATKYFLLAVGAVTVVLVGLAIWPSELVASPRTTLRIIDQDAKPLVGVRVTRHWDTSERQKGEDQQVTDNSGQVAFARVAFAISHLQRITRPLLIFVPVSCGPGWEIYGHAEFDIYWPDGYTLKFDDGAWRKANATYENDDGIHIYDPLQAPDKSYVGLYTWNKKSDFAYTLMLYKSGQK